MKSHTRLLVSIIAISMVANATACSAKIETDNGKEIIETGNIETASQMPSMMIDNVIEQSVIENNSVDKKEDIVEPISTEIIKEKGIEDKLKETLYDELIDYKLVINNYLITDYDKRENIKNDYLRALYMLMYNSNIPMSTYIDELHTLILMQQIPMCVPEDIWNESFGNLIALNPECLSIYEMYIDLAMYIHDIECNKEHFINEYYGYSCNDLEEEYTRRLEIPSI